MIQKVKKRMNNKMRLNEGIIKESERGNNKGE